MRDLIPQYLHIAGVTKDSPEWGLQYNLTHASLSPQGIRLGLDHRIKSVLRSRGLGKETEEGKRQFVQFLLKLIRMVPHAI